MHSVAFICTANVCRSVMAHAILAAEVARRALPIRVTSAGIYDFNGTPPAENAWVTCLQHQTPVPKLESTFVGSLDLSSIDHFLTMERHHAEVLTVTYQINRERVALLSNYDPKGRGPDIADPMNQGIVAFEQCYLLLQDCIKHYLDALVLPDRG